jgi:hypothetical protein
MLRHLLNFAIFFTGYYNRPAIFQKVFFFFFSLPGEVFLVKKKKKSFYEKFAGRHGMV